MWARNQALLAIFAGLALSVASASAGGCGGSKTNPLNGDDNGADDSGFGGGGGDDSGGGGASSGGGASGGGIFGTGGSDAGSVTGNTCANGGGLACDVAPNCTTSLTGTVYDPAGRNPIYNAVVYIPTDPAGKLQTITPGTHTCSSCDVSIGDYVTATTTDAKGHFTLTGVPAAAKVPFVVQIGKWRREVFLPTIKACTTTAVPAASSRLPKNKGEGDMPQMALLTGLADQLGCFMAQLGIDPKEFTAPHGGGRLDVYQGVGGSGVTGGTAGNCQSSSCPLWATKADLESYDIAVLACEGGEHPETKTMPEIQNMHDWLNEGGKVFATHFHYVWFKSGPTDFANAATWKGFSGGTGAGQYAIDTTFPKGKVLHDWLSNVGALTNGTIAMTGVADSVGAVNKPTQRWIYDSSSMDVKYLSLLTPVGGAPQAADAGESSASYCGKAVFSDLHAGGTSLQADVPGGCPTGALTAQEQALEFLFFDLSACVANESLPPPPPPQPTK
jgi:hypothetical protein